jgi:hypothetical protein
VHSRGTVLEQSPYSGHVFVFRGKRADLVKVLWWDGDGLCLFAKRLERERFVLLQAENAQAIWPYTFLLSVWIISGDRLRDLHQNLHKRKWHRNGSDHDNRPVGRIGPARG